MIYWKGLSYMLTPLNYYSLQIYNALTTHGDWISHCTSFPVVKINWPSESTIPTIRHAGIQVQEFTAIYG